MTLDKIWITKWALQRGILVATDARISDTGTSVLVTQGNSRTMFSGREWHQSEARAVLRVLDLVHEKRRATARQLEQLALLERRYDNGDYKVTEFEGTSVEDGRS